MSHQFSPQLVTEYQDYMERRSGTRPSTVQANEALLALARLFLAVSDLRPSFPLQAIRSSEQELALSVGLSPARRSPKAPLPSPLHSIHSTLDEKHY
jgi:hypothetical protein